MTNLEVPWLRSGKGASPSEGGCILQVIDWLDRGCWTDSPKCVHPVIRVAAIRANDHMPPHQRQKLLDLTSRMMGTNVGDYVLTRQLLGYLARQVFRVWEEYAAASRQEFTVPIIRACIEAGERGETVGIRVLDEAKTYAGLAAPHLVPSSAAWAAAVAVSPTPGDPGYALMIASDPYLLLLGLLDRFEELTGCVPGSVDFAPVCRALPSEYKRVMAQQT